MFNLNRHLIRVAFVFLSMSSLSFAAVIEFPEPGNKLTANVTVDIERDPSTHLYTYRYSVFNSFSSIQSIEDFFIQIAPDIDIVAVSAPKGWDFGAFNDGTFFVWSAVEIDKESIPDNWDGNLLPSSYQIKPGEERDGFILQTYSSPGEGIFYARGFTRMAVMDDAADLEDEGFEELTFPDDSFKGFTSVPISGIYDGNRRPGVDGFLGFINLDESNNFFTAPVSFLLKFSLNDENVNRSTFKAELNREDVTQFFIADPSGAGDLVGRFELLTSPLQVGRNVLVTSVEGEIIGKKNNRLAIDTDRIAFEVNDINADVSSPAKVLINFKGSSD